MAMELFRHNKQQRGGYTLWSPPGRVETYVRSDACEDGPERLGLDDPNKMAEVAMLANLLSAATQNRGSAAQKAAEANLYAYLQSPDPALEANAPDQA